MRCVEFGYLVSFSGFLDFLRLFPPHRPANLHTFGLSGPHLMILAFVSFGYWL